MQSSVPMLRVRKPALLHVHELPFQLQQNSKMLAGCPHVLKLINYVISILCCETHQRQKVHGNQGSEE